jgi:hypothetical protein
MLVFCEPTGADSRSAETPPPIIHGERSMSIGLQGAWHLDGLVRRWSKHDACKRAPPPLRLRPVRPVPPARDAIPGPRRKRPIRPVRPVLSLAPATRRSVASDRRAPVLIRIDAGPYTTATNTHPRQPQIHDGPEPRMRRHLRRWSKQDACKNAPPRLRLRPVRPVPPARDAIPDPGRIVPFGL